MAFPVLSGLGNNREEEVQEKEEDRDEEVQVVGATKGEIKRMKQDAKDVLYRPISEGFGFKMLQKMGWKEGEGLGKEEKGLATPLWCDPREGRAGLFSAESGEVRPKKTYESEVDWYNPPPLADNPVRFVTEDGTEVPRAGTSPGAPTPASASQSQGNTSQRPSATPARPSVATVAPALLGLLTDKRWQSGSGSSHLGANVIGELLVEALSGEAGERFLRLVDERLGPQVAPRLAAMNREATPNQTPDNGIQALDPLWQLTSHHLPGNH